MDRRKSLKTLLGGAVGTALITQVGCKDPGELVPESATEAEVKGYGLRTAYEARRDEKIRNDKFFTDFEKATIGVLADIIVPGPEGHPPATETGVVDFIEFMALDQPQHQELRGGLAWINTEASHRFGGPAFIELTPDQQLEIVDDIAYPQGIELVEDQEKLRHNDPDMDPQRAKAADLKPGVKFFDHLRFLVVTGYFTSKEGVAYLDYQGNQANVWDGVPQEVLDKHGLAYDEKYLPLYVDQSKRNEVAEWDDNMNLLT